MHWEKKICIRITTRRIIGAILAASAAVNLIIVGAALEAAAPIDESTATRTVTSTTPLEAPSIITTATISSETLTYTATLTITGTATDVLIGSPTMNICVPRTDWAIYRVRPGDTLSSLARATESNVDALKLANCLTNDQVYVGQYLRVPRFPRDLIRPSFTATATSTASSTDTATDTATATSTDTPTPTATDTPSPTPTNPPTVFENPRASVDLCSSPDTLSIAVLPYDPDGVRYVTAFYNINGGSWIEMPMSPDGDTYYGFGFIKGDYSMNDVVSFYFRALDNLEDVIDSNVHSASLMDCPPTPQASPTPGIFG
jgi:LysM repeat protein